MKATWFSSHVWERCKFIGAKRFIYNIKYLNTLVAYDMTKALKYYKMYKDKNTDNSDSDIESELFNF